MPPVTPSRTRRRSNGRMPGPSGLAALLGAAARHDAVHDASRRQLLHRARRELLLSRRRPVARELVEHARVLRGDEHAEVLVRRLVHADEVAGSKYTHCQISQDDDEILNSVTLAPAAAPAPRPDAAAPPPVRDSPLPRR